jgi:hypothetical protein
MSHLGNGYDINQTFVIEPFENSIPELSACTAVYTNFIQSCSGDTSIFLGTGIVSVNGNLSATTVSATTFYGDGSHLTGIATQDTYVTGGTYTNGTATFTNNTGGTFNVSGFYTGYTAPIDIFVTGATYSAGTAVFTNNTGGTFSVSGFSTSATFTGGTVTGTTYFTNGLSANTISATTFYGDGSHLTGLVTQDTFVTGGTYTNGTATFKNNTGGTFNVSGFTMPFTGGTVSGPTNFTNGLTANTISATTYYNLPRVSNVVTVAMSGGDFTSIADAVDSITTSSSNNRYVVKVSPGRYVEPEILLKGKEFISVVGEDILEVLVVAATANQNIFTLGNNNELSFMTISGATSGVAINCTNVDGFSLVHKISIYDCDINVLVNSSSANTNFYGEYIDFNGTYSYGTKVLAQNGFIAYANIENYYNYPTGPNTTIANSVQGSGATLSVFVGDGIGNGATGSTNYEISDYASLNTTTTTAEGWGYCLRNLNIGGPCRFDIDSLSVVDSINYDVYIEHSGTFGTFNGSSTHTKINTVSQNIYWSFLDSVDGEFEITRKMSVTFEDGTHTDASTLIFEGSTMGLIDGGVITVVSGLTINVSSGFGYLEKTSANEIYRRIDFPSSNLVLSANTNNYVFFNDNAVLSASGSLPDSTQNIILGRVISSASTIQFIDASPFNASHTSNGLSLFNRDALGPVYSSGSIVTQNTTPFHLNISSGSYYFSENNFTPTGGTNVNFSQYIRNGSGWKVTQTNSVPVGYDNNTGAVTSLPLSAFTKHTLYVVGEGNNEKYFLVLGQTTYVSLVTAEGADLPTPPTYFSDSVAPIASIYVQQGYSGITQIQDIRPVIGFKAAGVSATAVHANLLGLSSDDHKQYFLADGGRAMSGNLDMGANNIANVGTVNNVTVESHASRHKNGGADEIATDTPAPSEIPKADTFGKLDSWISTASDSVTGLTKLSVAPVYGPIAVGVNDNRFLYSFTGGTYSGSSSTLSLYRNDGTIYNISGFSTTFTGGTVNGLTANTISATTYYNLPKDVFVTGGTYSNGNATFTNNAGGTFNVSGFTTQFTGGTVNGATIFTNGLTANTFSATSIYSPFTTGSVIFQGSGGTFTQNNSNLFWDNANNRLGINTNTFWGSVQQLIAGNSTDARLGISNTGKQGVYLGQISNTPQIFAYDYTAVAAKPLSINSFGGNVLIGTTTDSGYKLDVIGIARLSGNTLVNGGLTAYTISATTYQNLPVSAITSGTNIGVSNTNGNYTISFTGTTGSNFTGGTVSGATQFTGGLTANTISATTYSNLPVTADTFTTGFTYSNNVFTLSRNLGLASLTATINTMTGLTVNGATALNGSITSTVLTGTTDRMMEVSSGGTVSASKQIISAYLTSGGTVANLLENTANWDIDGNYTGTTITGTYQGQKHYNPNYFFEAVADNLFIRLIRG